MIPLNIPTCSGKEQTFVNELLQHPSLFNEKPYSQKCTEWFQKVLGKEHVFLTKSCTHALELAALLLELQPGDEVILPSFTFVAAANALVLRGVIPVFIDIRPDTLNIQEEAIEQAITDKTRAIVIMHYASVPCNMDRIEEIAQKHNLYIIEDAAHCILAKDENGQYLGTRGDFGCFSFDQMKNITCDQGGLFIINNEKFWRRAEILYENGTDKRQFLRGEIPFYSWRDKGTNFKLSELQAAYLYGQLTMAEEIVAKRVRNWNLYYTLLKPLADRGCFELPESACAHTHNAHIFYIKVEDKEERSQMMEYMYKEGVMATFHYVPLHSAYYGNKVGRFAGEDLHTTKESERLLRLPLFYKITDDEIQFIVQKIFAFFRISVQSSVPE